mmetsp:Transcript_7407/g.20557  ORF Transcript_7407/g.20557 Transcript_7407/m.20557 type:complete len:109 (+) Transcript_7407:367-693(+)
MSTSCRRLILISPAGVPEQPEAVSKDQNINLQQGNTAAILFFRWNLEEWKKERGRKRTYMRSIPTRLEICCSGSQSIRSLFDRIAAITPEMPVGEQDAMTYDAVFVIQ